MIAPTELAALKPSDQQAGSGPSSGGSKPATSNSSSPAATPGGVGATEFQPLVPATNKKKIPANTEVRMRPTNLLSTVFGNLAVVDPAKQGWMSVYPCDKIPSPLTADLNYMAGQTTSSGIIARTSSTGDICFYSSEETHVVFDLTYLARFTSIELADKKRILDTRQEIATKYKLKKDEITKVTLSHNSVFESLRGKKKMIYGSITAVTPSESGFVSFVPCVADGGQPLTAALNFQKGEAVTNAFVYEISDESNADDKVDICLHSSAVTDIVIDAGEITVYNESIRDFTYLNSRFLDGRESSRSLIDLNTNSGKISFGKPNKVMMLNVTPVPNAYPHRKDNYMNFARCGYAQRGNDKELLFSNLNYEKDEVTLISC